MLYNTRRKQMKMVKNIAVVAFAASFMFANIGFHMSNIYSGMDGDTAVNTSYGATFDLNGSTGLGWDSDLGMMMYFSVPAGVSLRLGWDGATHTGVGLGFTWWTGGTGVKTSISTAYDMVSADGGASEGVLSVSVGFGF